MTVTIRLLGGFDVVVDGATVPADAWSRRQAASLVKVLALAHGRRLHREQIIDALWPGVSVDDAGPRLHKAAHYARRALGGGPMSVSLRNEIVSLLPDVDVRVDVDDFRRLGQRAIEDGSVDVAALALAEYRGPLLPEDPYEPWASEAREATSLLHLDLLRLAERWQQLLEVDPSDELAHLALIRAYMERRDVRAAVRQFERLDRAMRRGLGTRPSHDAERLRARLDALVARPEPTRQGARLVGRRHIGDLVRSGISSAVAGKGSTLLVTGSPGVGKTAVLDLAEALAQKEDWRTARGTASAVEGPWPYAPVLEAFGDLCRQHPALLDGLDDIYQSEIERALSGRDMTWTGESSHQRLFVAVAELMRLAATGHGFLLMVDDIHEADEASLRLLHYLSRCAISEPVLIVLAHRPVTGGRADDVTDSLVRKGIGARVELAPLDASATRRLLSDRFPDLTDDVAEQIYAVSAGVPFTVLELARHRGAGPPAVLPMLPSTATESFQRVALLGMTFTTDELLALSDTSEDETYQQLEAALAALTVEPAEGGYRFRHALVREALVESMPPAARSRARREIAERIEALGAPPARLARLYLNAGLPSRAVPFALPAVDTAGALGGYRDALDLIEAVREHAGPNELPRLLARRGDLLQVLGDPAAVDAYKEAVPVTSGTEHRLVRARLAGAAAFTGDFATSQTALAGLSLDGDAADPSILLARGNLAFFEGDIDTAWEIASQARALLQPDDPWQVSGLVSLQGLIAHQRGEWFDRFHLELRQTQGKQRLATALFDAHLCVAEYLLYGPVPYEEVIRDAEGLRRDATRIGALRGIAFATALIGEAALLMGDLGRAERELTEAIDLHRESDAPAGEAHALQRLAEVRLAQGSPAEARRLLDRALPLARWSVMGSHLLQRIYGTMIAAAPDPESSRAVVDQAEATMGSSDDCFYCSIMLAVPATIACADVRDLEAAHRHLLVAKDWARRWTGTSWSAAILEAEAHVAQAEGRWSDAATLLTSAIESFSAAGHVVDADRCRQALHGSRLPSAATVAGA